MCEAAERGEQRKSKDEAHHDDPPKSGGESTIARRYADVSVAA
jgi:hypothetical protein